jgi:hypothetical protein
MKQSIILTLIMGLFLVSKLSIAQNPIPSYNIPVYLMANFLEGAKDAQPKGKKKIKVMGTCNNSSKTTCLATVYAYSLDQQTILGPYTLAGGQTLSIDIDDRDWGVFVQSDDHIIVSVWIEEGKAQPSKRLLNNISWGEQAEKGEISKLEGSPKPEICTNESPQPTPWPLTGLLQRIAPKN